MRQPKTKANRTRLTEEEERQVVSLALRHADTDLPVNLNRLAKAASIIISTFPAERHAKLRFTKDKPVIKWIRNFYCRYKRVLQYAVPSLQEQKRYALVNALTLATHSSVLKSLSIKYCLTADRVWNLDETAISPGRDVRKQTRPPRCLRRGAVFDCQQLIFAHADRLTVLP